MISVILSIVVVTLLTYIVYLAKNVNSYWKDKGIKCMKPILFFGNTLPVFLRKKHISEIYVDLCRTYPEEPILGFYDNVTTRLIVQDSEFIERILIKDFQHFTDHGFPTPDDKKNPIDHYRLFVMRGAKWRALRYKMSPLFTTGKLKQFFNALDCCGDKIVKYIEKNPKTDVDLKQVMQMFVTDFVGMSLFGFDSATIDNPDSDFYKMAGNSFDSNFIKTFLLVMAPKLGEKLGTHLNSDNRVAYITKVLQDVFKQRKESKIQRNDFIQMMMQLKEKGNIEIENWDKTDDYLKSDKPNTLSSFEITDDMLMSQAFTFLTTGLDTVPLLIHYCFYEISMHQEIQHKLREEIIHQTKLHSGLTFEAIKDMKYLENVISETARLHPLVLAIMRLCTKDYTFPNGYEIKMGEMLHIPIRAVHLNPNYHSDPLEFKPERFDYPMKPGIYFPFGDGPRVCIAMRFAMLQMKFALAKILTHYKVKLSPKTEHPFKLKPVSIIVKPESTLYFQLFPIS